MDYKDKLKLEDEIVKEYDDPHNVKWSARPKTAKELRKISKVVKELLESLRDSQKSKK